MIQWTDLCSDPNSLVSILTPYLYSYMSISRVIIEWTVPCSDPNSLVSILTSYLYSYTMSISPVINQWTVPCWGFLKNSLIFYTFFLNQLIDINNCSLFTNEKHFIMNIVMNCSFISFLQTNLIHVISNQKPEQDFSLN